MMMMGIYVLPHNNALPSASKKCAKQNISPGSEMANDTRTFQLDLPAGSTVGPWSVVAVGKNGTTSLPVSGPAIVLPPAAVTVTGCTPTWPATNASLSLSVATAALAGATSFDIVFTQTSDGSTLPTTITGVTATAVPVTLTPCVAYRVKVISYKAASGGSTTGDETWFLMQPPKQPDMCVWLVESATSPLTAFDMVLVMKGSIPGVNVEYDISNINCIGEPNGGALPASATVTRALTRIPNSAFPLRLVTGLPKSLYVVQFRMDSYSHFPLDPSLPADLRQRFVSFQMLKAYRDSLEFSFLVADRSSTVASTAWAAPSTPVVVNDPQQAGATVSVSQPYGKMNTTFNSMLPMTDYAVEILYRFDSSLVTIQDHTYYSTYGSFGPVTVIFDAGMGRPALMNPAAQTFCFPVSRDLTARDRWYHVILCADGTCFVNGGAAEKLWPNDDQPIAMRQLTFPENPVFTVGYDVAVANRFSFKPGGPFFGWLGLLRFHLKAPTQKEARTLYNRLVSTNVLQGLSPQPVI
jgi:hypothetical protein